MSTVLSSSNDSTINTAAITGAKAGGASLYNSKEGYDRQNSYSKEAGSGSGWGSISPRKAEGFQWPQSQAKQAEQGLIGKLLTNNTDQMERTRLNGLVPLSPSGGRSQTFNSQSAATQTSQSTLNQNQQSVLNQPQQFAQTQQLQPQQQFVQSQQQFTQPQQFQQSTPLLQKQQSFSPSQFPLSQQWGQPTKTLWAGESGPVSVQQPPVCLSMEALVIKPEPIMVPQPPVMFQPEAIQIAQPPIVFRPEPITIPLPPLTVQPEPVMVQRPPLMIQPAPVLVRRPDVQMNPSFSLALKYGCSTTNDVAGSTDQCVPISSLTASQRAGLGQFGSANLNQSSLSQPAKATRSQSYSIQ